MLVEIHILQNHSPSNLNRDDTGSPKECVFGGVKRARISSQCLKRSIRTSDIFQQAMAGRLGMRTRRLPELVRERLLASGVSEELTALAAQKTSGFGTNDGRENVDSKKEQTEFETRQTMFLTQSDIDAVTEVMKTAIAEAGTAAKFEKVAAKDLQASAQLRGFRPVTVDVALFGRMITSGAFRDVEACAQVAHAVSTHKVDHEYDYFTAMDDLQGITEDDEDAGADMIGDVEFNSACYYKYFSIDTAGLIDNLTGASAFRADVSDEDRKEASEITAAALESFLRAAIMTTPSGKQNTFAAHQLPAAVLVEVRPYNTPVSYANAFVDPARSSSAGGLVSSSLNKLAAHVEALTDGFDLQSSTRLLLAPEHEIEIKGVETVKTLGELCTRMGEGVANG